MLEPREADFPITILNGLKGVGLASEGESDVNSLNRSLTSMAPTITQMSRSFYSKKQQDFSVNVESVIKLTNKLNFYFQ